MPASDLSTSAWDAVLAVLTFSITIGDSPVTLLHLLALLIVLPLGWAIGARVGRLVSRIVASQLERRAPQVTVGRGIHRITRRDVPANLAALVDLAGGLARWLTVFAVWMVGLEVVGLDMAIFKVFAGVIALGIPFAVTLIARNGVAGLVLAGEQTIKAGYLVKLASGHVGRVGVGNLFRTPVVTASGSTVYVPSGELLGGTVEVLSLDEWAPVSVRLYVNAGADFDEVCKAAGEAFTNTLGDGHNGTPTFRLAGQPGGNPSLMAVDVAWMSKRPAGEVVSAFLVAAFGEFEHADVDIPESHGC